MRFRHIIAFTMALALMLLWGCGGTEASPTDPVDPVPPSDSITTSPVPNSDFPQQTEPLLPTSGSVSKIGDSQLTSNNLSVQRVFVCDDDTVLFFVSPVNPDGTVSESIIIYSYSFQLGGFRTATYYAGTVSLFPEYVFDDGSVAIVTLDSESYDFDSLIFLDTATLSARKHPLPNEDFYNLHVSPDKSYVAISTFDYLLVTDLTYTQEYLRLERRPTPASAPEFVDDDEPDELVCASTGWSAGSDVLFFKTLGWNDAYSPGLIRVGTWEAEYLDELSGSILLPLGNKAFYCNAFSSLPAGTLDFAGGLVSPPKDYHVNGYSNGITADRSGSYVCVLSMVDIPGGNEYQCEATVSSIDGEYVNSFEITRSGDIISFEQAFFTPSGDRLVLVASGTLNYSRAVYTFDFLSK